MEAGGHFARMGEQGPSSGGGVHAGVHRQYRVTPPVGSCDLRGLRELRELSDLVSVHFAICMRVQTVARVHFAICMRAQTVAK